MFLIGAYTVEEVGKAVADYAYNLLEWGNKKENYYKDEGNIYGGEGPALRYNQHGSPKNRLSHPTLDNPNPELPWFYDCSSFTAAMYNMVCNQKIFPWDFTTTLFANSPDLLDDLGPVSEGDCKPGDIICKSGEHVEIFISSAIGTGGAHSNGIGVDAYSNKEGQVDCNGGGVISPSDGHIYRLKQEVVDGITDLNKDFSVKGGSSYGKAVNYSNFFFNGIPDGSYSLASRKSIFETLIDALSSLYNYLVGLLTYILRGVIISFISIFDRLINNTFSSLENSGTSKSLQDSGVSATSADDPASINRSITIEDLIFNKTDIFDINIFRVD